MKKALSILSTAAIAAINVFPFSANAADDTVYGMMNIPYADFYSAEVGGAYEVDAVSSATASKWSQNNTGSIDPETGKWKNGGLVAGTYNDGQGTILGITYPVAISADDEAYLTENFNFTKCDTVPAAYKNVSVTDGKLVVSAVVDAEPETSSGSVTVTTPSGYGDIQLAVKGYPENCDIYGTLFKTSDGSVYAARHLENIWRNGSFSWSVGVKTTESHGNALQYEDFVSSQGKTITEVTYITLDGYKTLTGIDAYIPVVVDADVTVENGAAGTGKTSFTAAGLPDDYIISGKVKDNFTVSGSTISYTDALPGNYTLTISDASGKYSSFTTNFVLSSDGIPVVYENGKLVAAKGVSDEEAANFIKNINSVTVNGTAYTTGKRGTKVVLDDGTVDMTVKSGDTSVFDGSGNYTLSVTATGYNTPYDFEIKAEEVPTSTTSTSSNTATSTTTKTSATAAASASRKNSNSDSPKTGVAGVGLPAAILTLAGAASFAFRKKND